MPVRTVDPDSPRVNAYLRATMAPKVHSYLLLRFDEEAMRLTSVLETLLDGREYMAGTGVSIADFSAYA